MMYAVSLEAVMRSDYPRVIRDAAERLSHFQYLDVGTFLGGLHEDDLQELNNMCARISIGIDTPEDFDSISLLSSMLSQAEGNSLEEAAAPRISNLIILISFENLARKGQIIFRRELATLAEELLDKNIASLK